MNTKEASTKIECTDARHKEVQQNCVFVVDDDPSMRNALKNLLRSAGFEPQLFASAREFLDTNRPDLPSCLILDIRLPGLSGLDLQRELSAANSSIPIIFISGHVDDTIRVRAMEAGAIVCLTKPFCDRDLLHAIHVSLTLATTGPITP
jgi:FixJ family two-component response regulator